MLKFLKETKEQVQEEIKENFKERADGRNISMLLENKVKGKEHQQLAAENNLTRTRVSQLCKPIDRKLGRILPAREIEIVTCLDEILGEDKLLYLPEALGQARPGSKTATSAGQAQSGQAQSSSAQTSKAQPSLDQESLKELTEVIRLYNLCAGRKLYLIADLFISRLKQAEVRELLAAKISKGGAGLTVKRAKVALGSRGLSQAGFKALMSCFRHYQPYDGRVYHALNKNEVAAAILWTYFPDGLSLRDSQQMQEFKKIFADFIQATGLNHTSNSMETLFKNDQQYSINIGNLVFIHKDHLEVNEEALEEVRAFIEADLEVMEETNIQRLYPEFKGRPGFDFIKSETMFFAILRERLGDQFVFHNRDRILPDKMRGKKIKSKGQLIKEYIESHGGTVKQAKTWRHFANQYGWHYPQCGKQVSMNDSIETNKDLGVKYLVIY